MLWYTAGVFWRAVRRGGSLWSENAGAADGPSRVNILGVVSADCHSLVH